jgi:phospholipase/carboxylesterase
MNANTWEQAMVINTLVPPKASVIWLHGLGADGHDFVPIVEELQLPIDLPIRFVFPHAPVQPVTLNGGYPMRAWYDILGLNRTAKEDEKGIRQTEKMLHQLIEHEHSLGVPTNKILLAGFSQGGAIALQCALRYPEKLAGILALSTYLPLAETLTQEASIANKSIPLFMAHGKQDSIVALDIALHSKEYLEQVGYKVDFRLYAMEHSVCREEIADISTWLQRVLAE